MFLSDALKTIISPDEHEAIPEFVAFTREVTDGLDASASMRLVAVIAATLLKQLTVWDRLAVRGVDSEVLGRVLDTFEQPNGYSADQGNTVLITRRPISRSVLETTVQHVSREDIFGVLPAPRGLLVFVLEDVDDVLRALRMQGDHPEATFSTVILSTLALSETDRLRPVLDGTLHRIAAWINSTGLYDQAEVVSVIAT